MLVKVAQVKTKADEGKAASFLAESISFTAKGIDGPYSATGTEYVHERACACTSRCKC